MRTKIEIASALVGFLLCSTTLACTAASDDTLDTTAVTRASVGADSTSEAGPTTTTIRPSTTTTPTVPPTTRPAPTTTTTTPRLLQVTDLKDGDSWDASDGQEYRLGLVNAPERSEPCGSAARDFSAAFLAGGFTADSYSGDRYGRVVAEVFDARGESLNVALAASGFGDGRYLEQFRAENPDLARRVEAALAVAPTPDCARPTVVAPVPLVPQQPSPSPTPGGGACHPAYSPCVPIKGDGSGNGSANDLDCGDIDFSVTLNGSADPYRFDGSDNDGLGCEGNG